MKLKEVNRGLVLGTALLVGVVFHVNWQNHQFKKNIPVIQKAVEEYGQDVLKSSLGDPKGLKRRTTAAIQNAYTGKGEIPEDVWESKSSILADIDSIGIDAIDGKLYDADFKVLDFKANKSGSGARVEIRYELDIKFSGDPVFFGIAGAESPSPWETITDDKQRIGEQEGIMDLYMKKDNDSWKILYVSNKYITSDLIKEAVGETFADDTSEVNGID